jgi:hypothetical protein
VATAAGLFILFYEKQDQDLLRKNLIERYVEQADTVFAEE